MCKKPDSLKILAPCGTQASIKKTVDKYGRRSTRARTSIPLEDPVVPDDGPLTFYPNGAANEPAVAAVVRVASSSDFHLGWVASAETTYLVGHRPDGLV